MIIHVIGTVNGLENEGMRNVATHMARFFEKDNTVLYSDLKDVVSILKNSAKSDVTIIFARANKMVYWMTRIIGAFRKSLWLVFVQKPDQQFVRLQGNHPLNCNFFALLESDIVKLPCRDGYQKRILKIGIRLDKFVPVDDSCQRALKQKYGFDPDKKLVVHVGHCSAGRGLEDFTRVNHEIVQTMVVASGLFESEKTVNILQEAGVYVHKGYLENVEEIYQMADAYLFPTRSAEFVISIPLSVMEALACGTPVIGYDSFKNLKEIPSVQNAITLVDTPEDISRVLLKVMTQKKDVSLLKSAVTWEQAAEEALQLMKEEIK